MDISSISGCPDATRSSTGRFRNDWHLSAANGHFVPSSERLGTAGPRRAQDPGSAKLGSFAASPVRFTSAVHFCAGRRPYGRLAERQRHSGGIDRGVSRAPTTARERFMIASGSVGAMIQRLTQVYFRKCGSSTIDGGASLLMNTGRSVCDLNRHALSLLDTHSVIKSATIIGGVIDASTDRSRHHKN
jgi:hypothetical protein